MSEQTPNLTPEDRDEEPFIPPSYLLILSGVGLLVALAVFFTQPTFTVVGWGGLGIAALSFFAWVVTAPEQARAALTGRTARFGGTSLLVTFVVIVALIAVYVFIRQQNWRVDLTERDSFSLTEQARQAVAGIGADPNTPQIRLIGFYDSTQAGRRDQDTLLLEDYRQTSAGKITYEFINPDQNPALAQQYGVTTPGQIVVVAVDEAGTPDIENAERVTFLTQDQLTNAVLRVAASGDFRAYFLSVDGGFRISDTGQSGLSTINDILTNQLDWTTQEVTFFQLLAPDTQINLLDPAADASVLVIPGGNTPLSEVEIEFLRNYIENGGRLVVFGAANFAGEFVSLATDPAFNAMLAETAGISFANNIVLDPSLSIQSPTIPVSVDFSTTSFITTNGISAQSGLVFEVPHSISISPFEGVTIDELARSTENAFAKTDYAAVLRGEVTKADDDVPGPFVLAASSGNSANGARVVLFGSASIPVNAFAFASNIANLNVSLNSLVWATNFNDFFTQITVQSPQRPQDTPIFIDQQTAALVNLLTIFVLPFGVLLVGVLVWWNSRPRPTNR